MRALCPTAGDDCLTLVLDDHDLADPVELRWNVLQHVLAGRRTVVVDLAGVTQLSSTAVAALLNLHRVLRAPRGRLLVRRPSPAAREFLEHTGLHRVLQLTALDEDEQPTAPPQPRREEPRTEEPPLLRRPGARAMSVRTARSGLRGA